MSEVRVDVSWCDVLSGDGEEELYPAHTGTDRGTEVENDLEGLAMIPCRRIGSALLVPRLLIRESRSCEGVCWRLIHAGKPLLRESLVGLDGGDGCA